MTKQELEAQAAKLQAELEAMKSKIAQMDSPTERWVPKKGDMYWCAVSTGDLGSTQWANHRADLACLSIGNCFRTREEAKRHVEKLKVIEEMKALAGYWEPDWSNGDQDKYVIEYSHHYECFKIGEYRITQNLNSVYFKSEADAQNAIKVLGDRLKVLL